MTPERPFLVQSCRVSRHPLKSAFLILLLTPAMTCAGVPQVVKDSLDDGKTVFTAPFRVSRTDAPMGLLFVGLLGTSLAFDKSVRRNLYIYRNVTSSRTLRRYGDLMQFSGLIAGAGLGASGYLSDNARQKHMAWDFFESFAWAGVVTQTTKVVLGRRRPNATSDPFELRPVKWSSSFPSGHTTGAFAAATTLSEYYPVWQVMVPAYLAAGTVGFSRLYANQHWASDVVGGALVGIVTAHTLYKKHNKEPTKTSWEIVPTFDGLAVSLKF
jgi:membrane-associated phospholipid phosphatase